MRLHHSQRSPYARKVVVLAHEAGITAQVELVSSNASPLPSTIR